MSAYPELRQLPLVVFCGQIGDALATAHTKEGDGLLVFLSEEDHAKSNMPVELKGENPVPLDRSRVISMCNVVYLCDPDKEEYVSFVVKEEVAR